MGVRQEFCCRKNGEGCGGFILLTLNEKINGAFTIVCPKCGHRHPRSIIKGEIMERGKIHEGGYKEDLCPPLSAWSEKSRLIAFTQERMSVVDKLKALVINPVTSHAESEKAAIAHGIVAERWAELYGDRI